MTDVSLHGERMIAARLERLPVSAWHIKVSTVLGVAIFFDAFDSIALAFVLPVLVGAWSIAPQQIGGLIAIGNAGQAIGALGCGIIAERFGRVKTAQWTILLFAAMSLACAFAQNFDQLFWLRFVQGIGLGGEVPVAAAYVTEITRADRRGSAYLFYQMIFPVGFLLAAIAGAWIVPRFGWQWMFIIGVAPAAVAAVLRRYCQESPRWLASRGRLDEAEKTLGEIEAIVSRNGARPLAAPVPLAVAGDAKRTRWQELFEGRYRKRTFIAWALWSSAYLVSYGLQTWLPTLYRTVYNVPLQQALNYTLIANICSLVGTLLCAALIDRLGRRMWFIGAFFLTGLPLIVLWGMGAQTVLAVIIATSTCYTWVASICLAVYLYTAEIYPTRMRALGTSWATFWLRIAATIGPLLVGFFLPSLGIGGLFLIFGAIAWLGCVAAFFTIEPRGRILEEVSP
jgi:MFS transporter, putative metabolite:H+ symporter